MYIAHQEGDIKYSRLILVCKAVHKRKSASYCLGKEKSSGEWLIDLFWNISQPCFFFLMHKVQENMEIASWQITSQDTHSFPCQTENI